MNNERHFDSAPRIFQPTKRSTGHDAMEYRSFVASCDAEMLALNRTN